LGLIAGAAFLIALVEIIAMFAVSQSTKRSRETEATLYQLQGSAQRLNANEWEAFANLKIDSNLYESSEQFRREILTDLQMIHALQGREGITDGVQRAVSTYLSATDGEFALVSNGQFDKARELDDSRLNPSFAILEHVIPEAVSTLETQSQRRLRTVFLGSAETLLACLASILFLALRFKRRQTL
jgi:hypothetical protein